MDPEKKPQVNTYMNKRGKLAHSTDHGLMQIHGKTWFGKSVKGPDGHPFRIGEEVKNDWKANARAGVAILADAYRLAELEPKPGTSPQDLVQQTYSQYNGELVLETGI